MRSVASESFAEDLSSGPRAFVEVKWKLCVQCQDTV